MNRSYLKDKAKKQIKGKIGILFLINLIIWGITIVANIIPVAGTVLAILIVTPSFTLSTSMIYLKLNEGETKVSDAFSGFKDFWPAFKVHFLSSLFTVLWSLLFLIPGIIKAISYSMSMYILAQNKEMTARECINYSKKITQNHKMDLFVLALSFIWWHLLVCVTFGIASIYVSPYIEATFANAYKKLRAEYESQPKVGILESVFD